MDPATMMALGQVAGLGGGAGSPGPGSMSGVATPDDVSSEVGQTDIRVGGLTINRDGGMKWAFLALVVLLVVVAVVLIKTLLG